MDTLCRLSRLITIQSKNLLPNYSASSLTLVGRYTVDLSLYMDTLSRLSRLIGSRFLDCMVISLDSLDSVSMYNDRSTVYLPTSVSELAL
jgi:hypothetical protein